MNFWFLTCTLNNTFHKNIVIKSPKFALLFTGFRSIFWNTVFFFDPVDPKRRSADHGMRTPGIYDTPSARILVLIRNIQIHT